MASAAKKVLQQWEILALVLLCVSVFVLIQYLFRNSTFDRAVWLAAAKDIGSNHARHEMAGDLLTNHLREGQAKKEILSLLGPPDAEVAASPRLPNDETDNLLPYTNSPNFTAGDARQTRMLYIYYLHSSGIDVGALCLAFDRSDRVLRKWCVYDID